MLGKITHRRARVEGVKVESIVDKFLEQWIRGTRIMAAKKYGTTRWPTYLACKYGPMCYGHTWSVTCNALMVTHVVRS
jgi:hypothetical protein